MNETSQVTNIGAGSGAGMDRRIERPHAKRRKLAIRIAIAIAVLVGAIALYWLVPSSNSLSVDSDSVQGGAVMRAPFQDYVPLRAEVAPLQSVFVAAISGGQVDTLIASDGQMVIKGAPLAQLANPALELDVASRSADIAGQLSGISGQRLTVQRNRLDTSQQVADAKNDLLKAQTEYQKKQTLFEKGIVNQAAVKPLADDVTYQRQRVAALQSGSSQESATLADQSARIGNTAAQLQTSLAMVRHSLDALTLRAPVGGRLTAFTLQPGQTLKPGDPVGQIDSEGAWKLTADVDQFYLGRAAVGQHAQADIDGRHVTLHVIKILPQVTDGRFKIELGFDGAAPIGLNRGQTIDVRLILGADQPAVVAPSGGWLDAGGGTVFVLNESGNGATRRTITTGRRNPDQVEVTSGLKPGERIVTSAIGTYAPYDHLIIH